MEYTVTCIGELYHFGTKGQKWGVRRYQNEDGSYKSGAEGRYNPDSDNSGSSKSKLKDAKAQYKQAKKDYRNSEEHKENVKKNLKTAAKVGAGIAAGALVAYGTYKLAKDVREKNVQLAIDRGHAEVDREIKNAQRLVNEFSRNKDMNGFKVQVNGQGTIKLRENQARSESFGKALKNVVSYKAKGGSFKDLRTGGSDLYEWAVNKGR